jgi:hypothetical protein
MKLVFYLFPITYQIYLPCHYGTQVHDMSEKLSTALFHSNWYKGDKNSRGLVKMFMEFAKKPIQIQAMGIFVVNVENFMTICKSAYSLFAVCQKVDK